MFRIDPAVEYKRRDNGAVGVSQGLGREVCDGGAGACY